MLGLLWACSQKTSDTAGTAEIAIWWCHDRTTRIGPDSGPPVSCTVRTPGAISSDSRISCVPMGSAPSIRKRTRWPPPGQRDGNPPGSSDSAVVIGPDTARNTAGECTASHAASGEQSSTRSSVTRMG